MENLRNITTLNKKVVILIGTLLLLILILLVVLVSSKPSQRQVPTSPKLTREENKYPEAPSQPFLTDTKDTGTLIVTSQINGLRILIDAPEEEVPAKKEYIPVNTNPFKISAIPVGKHTIFAFKQGYEIYEKPFEIKKDQITRLEIKLTSLFETQDPSKWLTRLPLQGQYYTAEFNQKAKNIIVTLDPPPAVDTTIEKQVDFLKKLVLEDLKNIGVDTTIEKIEWVIK